MGHACAILTFNASMDKNEIQRVCDDWGNANADLQERGYSLRGLGFPINFSKDQPIFDDYQSASEYLDKTFGDYKQTAVRYREYPCIGRTKRYDELSERLVVAKARLFDLEKPHYAGVSIKTIKCKHCGSSLATEYCGKSWDNNCPICRADLRPASKLDRIAKTNETIRDIKKALREEEQKAQKKMISKSTIHWAVACEVHS